jgi:hypothetical protein
MSEAEHSTSLAPYARNDDFRKVFHEETASLYRLAFLLTADREKAQQCFVAGLEDSVNGRSVFKDWAHSWARRTIIQNAVRAINPRPMAEQAPSSFSGDGKKLVVQAEMTAVLELGPFDRFVYVMSVLEHYSDLDCSVLLNCARRDVIAARIHALRQIEMQSIFTLERKVNGETLNRTSTGDLS